MNNNDRQSSTGLEIAVIGMSGRFPGAAHINRFWDNLVNGREAISFFSGKELEEEGIKSDLLDRRDFIKAKGMIEEVEYFDSNFFDYTPREAEIMDPQVRLFHECAWEALEDAGYDPWTYPGLIGLYAGASPNIYWEAMTHFSGKNRKFGAFAANFNNDKDFLTLLVSYKMNLKGPVISFFTTCSTSLVGVHLGCRALLTGECHMVLAGGVTVGLPQRGGQLYQEGMVISSDGHCRAFDSQASGTMGGDGIGIVVLKPLAAAIDQGDHIYAVIKGSAVNNDGDRRIGFTAPSISGQAEAIKRALHMAEVPVESIRYIEAHGTGTALGDPIEIEALKSAFNSGKTGTCGLGSVKTNIGHLDCAAGIAGFIKAVLVVKHRLIPPSLHFERPNPKIDFSGTPFYVNRTLESLENTPFPLRAGLSSFGMGGTNAHVILEEPPQASGESDMRAGQNGSAPYQLVLLSAKTETALAKAAENLAAFLTDNPRVNLADVAYTLWQGRKHFPWRRKFVCTDVNEAIAILSSTEPRKIQTAQAHDEKKTVVFMFPGLGPQYVNMGRELYEKVPLFQKEMDRGFEILKDLLNTDIKEILYPGDVSAGSAAEDLPGMHRNELAQPMIFIFEYALARLIMQWGVRPAALIGYSLGEYTAACIAGVFSLEEALKIIVIRGKLIQGLPAGGMLSVPLAKEQLEPLMKDFPHEISIAIDNGPSCIVSGTNEAVTAFGEEMKNHKLVCLRLNASHGLHSRTMAPVMDAFIRAFAGVNLKAPQIPYISNVTGTWITEKQAADPAYWAAHLAQTVRFSDGINQLLQQPHPIFIEVGPDRDLCSLLANQPGRNTAAPAVNLVRPPLNQVPDLYYLLSKLGQLWLYGIHIRWQPLLPGEKRLRLSLPAYPFERLCYPVRFETAGMPLPTPDTRDLMVKKTDISDWFYYPSWIRSQLPAKNPDQATEPGCWLVFTLETPFCSLFIKTVQQQGHQVVSVFVGEGFQCIDRFTYTLDPASESDYTQLFRELAREEKMPSRIVHFWSMSTATTEECEIQAQDIENAMYPGFYSMVYLAKALGKQKVFKQILLQVITCQLQEVTGQEVILPHMAAILGPLKVIPQEYPFIRCQNADILVPPSGSSEETRLVEQLLEELADGIQDTDIAFRNRFRWVKTYRPICLGEVPEQIPLLRENGVYLITGGLGKIGLTLAGYLAERVKARVILIGRNEFPPRQQWDQIIAAAGDMDITALKIKKLKQIEARGGQVMISCANVVDIRGMEAVISEAEQCFGPVNGVIHAAGDTQDTIMRALEHLTPSDCQQQFLPKIYGLLTLEKVLIERERGREGENKLDFCWLTSSLSPILGGLGFSAYSAANHFMDVFVKWQQRKQQANSGPAKPGKTTRWISVNWADWKFGPAQQESPDSQNSPGPGEMNREAWWMMPHEGIETFRRILYHCDTQQVVVSTVDLQTRLDRWVALKSLRQKQEHPSASSAGIAFRARPPLETDYVKPANPIEQAIAAVLQDFLGISEVGSHDNFFELGATSLNIIQINTIVREKLQQDISVLWWFAHPTIKTLSAYLLARIQENSDAEAIAEATRSEEKRDRAVKKGKTRLDQLKKRK